MCSTRRKVSKLFLLNCIKPNRFSPDLLNLLDNIFDLNCIQQNDQIINFCIIKAKAQISTKVCKQNFLNCLESTKVKYLFKKIKQN